MEREKHALSNSSDVARAATSRCKHRLRKSWNSGDHVEVFLTGGKSLVVIYRSAYRKRGKAD